MNRMRRPGLWSHSTNYKRVCDIGARMKGDIETSSGSGDASSSLEGSKPGELNYLTDEKKTRRPSTASIDGMIDDWKIIKYDPQLKKERIFKIWKNLILICIAFVGNFTAFNGASSLQSSLNSEEGLGTTSLAIIYASLIISAMFLPTYVINFFGCKWTIVIAICGYVTYPLANFYPHWGTLIPSSIFVGLSAAPLWSAKCTYLTRVAKEYAFYHVDENDKDAFKQKVDSTVNRFFGIFFLFFQSTQIIGNLISSFILSADVINELAFPSCYNETYIKQNCGKGDCQGDLNAARIAFNSSECPVSELNSAGPAESTIYILMGIYTAIGLCGAFVMGMFVDNIKVRQEESRGPFRLLIATFKHMKDKRQLLLIPITMYSGFEQAFLTGDYTRSFITCPLGVNWVGFVLICYGGCDAICSLLFGGSEKYVGRFPLFTGAALINLGLIITFQVWVPYPQDVALFFILPALWGVADAVWQTQLNAFYGFLFVSNAEASFANYRLWESLGFVIAFAYQNFICVSAKLWVLLSVLIVGMALYYLVEYKEWRRTKKPSKVTKVSPEDNEAYLDSRSNVGNGSRLTSF